MSLISSIGVGVDFKVMDLLMPMHVVIGSDFRIAHVGPTMRRLRANATWIGEDFREVFDIRRPRGLCVGPEGRQETQGITLHVQLVGCQRTMLKGVMAHLPDGNGVLMNFGFGIGVIDAVRTYDLSASDFAPTDLTIEMLYLVEAKSAVMEESRDLNRRLQAAKRAAEIQAQTDPLTGARNRRALEVELQRLIGERLPFGLMHIDLDRFKEVNDTLGHAAGDHVLKIVSDILSEEIRGTDFISRIGGDEFVLVLPDLTTKAAIDALAERIITRIQEPIDFDGVPCQIGASIGSTRTSLYDKPTIERMSRDADIALYESKREGRGRHTCASAAPDAGVRRRASDEVPSA
jgi:diguanylate cyclase (GGDEF)-like protein